MKNIHYELYTRYYGATVGRFYTEKERMKLLSLFARGFAISPESEEFKTVVETVKTIDSQGIKDYSDSKNYHLICSILNSEDELFSASTALAVCYEARTTQNAPVYSGAIEWRASVCKSLIESEENLLESAYIKYCCGLEREAVEIFSDLALDGDVLALEHLTLITYDLKMYEDALFNLLLLEKTINEELCLEAGSWILTLKATLAEALSPEVARKIATRVKKNARLVSENRAKIGFVTGRHTHEKGT